MKLWDKGFSTDKKIDLFTVGNDRIYDQLLVKYDLKASRAHGKMLHKIGILNDSEANSIDMELQNLEAEVAAGTFKIEDSFEDMHSKIEFELTKRLGEAGKKIHTARSRNDQVLVAMQLYLKEVIEDYLSGLEKLFDLLLQLAEQHKAVLLPGYTHLQVAMPSSFGLWFSAYAESLIDDVYLLKAAYRIVDQNPLGSAAGYGSSFPIDRSYTTATLGFHTLKYNVVAAQMGRAKVERAVAMAMSSVASTLGKMAMDICLYMSQNFDFISFPDELTTGSSIMPHKKNPDVFELIRAKCNVLQGIPNQLNLLTTNLPSGYHRDLQLAKELFVPSAQTLDSCLEMMTFSLKQIRVNSNILEDQRYAYLFSVDVLNNLVKQGVPFRDAYKQIAAEIEAGTFKPDPNPEHSHQGSLGNLCLEEIRGKMSDALED